MFRQKIESGEPGILLYGITPPRRDCTAERVREITANRIKRIQGMDVDGLIVYDLQNESLRTSEVRPFPYLPTIDAGTYSNEYLSALDLTRIVRRPVATETPESFAQWAAARNNRSSACVLVGAPSRDFPATLKLSHAYRIRQQVAPKCSWAGSSFQNVTQSLDANTCT